MGDVFDETPDDEEEGTTTETESALPSSLEFNLERKTIPVTLTDPKSGEKRSFTLQELDGNERDKYLNLLGSRMKVGPDGKPKGIKDFKDLQAHLVCSSMLDDKGQNVPIAMIQKWPVSVQAKLFKTCQTLSALDEVSEKEVKND